MAKHVFDAHLQRRCRTWATLAGPAHLQRHHPVIESLENDVAPIHGHFGTNTSIEELLDLLDDFIIVLVLCLTGVLVSFDHRHAGREMFHDTG